MNPLEIIGGLAISTGFLHIISPLTRSLVFTANESWANELPSISEALAMVHRNQLSYQDFEIICNKRGFSNSYALKLYNISLYPISIQEGIEARHREKISDERLNDIMGYNGIATAGDIDILKEINTFIPSILDAVKLCADGVLDEDFMHKWNLPEGYSAKLQRLCEKQGCSGDVSEQIWSAHWRNIRSDEIASMLHRDLISESEAEDLLTYNGVLPSLQSNILETLQTPISIRYLKQIHAMDKFSDEELAKKFKILGYNVEDTKTMMEALDYLESPPDKGLSRESLVKAFKRDLITEQELRDYLKLMDYPSTVVEFWAKLAIDEKSDEELKEAKNYLKLQYESGKINKDVLRDELHKLGLTAGSVVKSEQEILKTSLAKIKDVSVGDIKEWYKKGIIDDKLTLIKLSHLGYNLDDIRNYLLELKMELGTIKRKYLKVEEYLNWYNQDIIDAKYLSEIFTLMGFKDPDKANMLIDADTQKELYIKEYALRR